jgi:hypothetical protein
MFDLLRDSLKTGSGSLNYREKVTLISILIVSESLLRRRFRRRQCL